MPDKADNKPPRAHQAHYVSRNADRASKFDSMPQQGQRQPAVRKAVVPQNHLRWESRCTTNNMQPAFSASASTRHVAPAHEGNPPSSDDGNKRRKLDHDTDKVTISMEYYKTLQQEVKRLEQTAGNQKAEIQKHGQLLISYRSVNDDRTAEVAELRNAVTDLKQNLERTQHHNTSIRALQSQISQRRTELKTKDEDFKNARDLIVQLQSSKAADSMQSRKVTDNDIERLWGQLVFMVRQFVDSYARFPASQPPSQAQRWKDLVSQPEEFFASENLYPLVLETHIWFRLTRKIFSSKAHVWGGKNGETFYKFADGVHESITQDDTTLVQFNDWRVRSVNFLRSLKPQQADMARYQKAVHNTLFDLFEPQEDKTLNEAQAVQDMQDIFTSAAELDLIFRQSKAMFTVCHSVYDLESNTSSNHGFGYTPDTMNWHPYQGQDIPAGTKVDMIVAPALVKQGNADGANYASKKVLIKMTVVAATTFSLEQDASGVAGKGTAQDGSQAQPRFNSTPPSSQYQGEEMMQVDDRIKSESLGEN